MNIDVILKLLIIVTLFVVIFILIRIKRTLKYEDRIGKYSINPINNNDDKSLSENIIIKYNNLLKKIRKKFAKSKILIKYSKKYDKYADYDEGTKGIDYVFNKIIISIVFVILSSVILILKNRSINIFTVILNLIIGFYLYDLYLIFQSKRKNKLIKEQILRAIIIMNNAFKAGKSTLQAVQIASNELAYPLNKEFKKMYKDVKYGLSIDTAFERFSKRVNVEEVNYISSSLIILNKTGGNIIKVFSEIEKTLFTQKKLREELKNLTESSKLVVKVLTFVPIVFILIIYLLNPTYFDPLFSSVLGYMIILLIVVMFIIYTYALQKVMKVKV